MVRFSFAGQDFAALGAGALWWPARRALVVADLHLEKGSWFAKGGQMLPPYDSLATLADLTALAAACTPAELWCLGDSFHDAAGCARLPVEAQQMLRALTGTLDWVWVTGNHDSALDGKPQIGGTIVDELAVGGVILRHRAHPGEIAPELSGHYHPRLRVELKGRRIARPCVVIAANDATGAGRMILPAFGSLTGGMDAGAPEILDAMQPAAAIDALLPTAWRLARFPLWRRAA